MALLEKISRRARHLLMLAAQFPRVFFYRCISDNSVRGKPKRFQPLQCAGNGEVSMEDGVSIGVFPSPFFFSTYAYIEARNQNAKIVIGVGTNVNNNFCAIAEHTSIIIGKHCRIGTNVEILDSDFHGIAVENRGKSLPELAKSVLINDHVLIGSNVKIMKGVTIGHGSIIANGSLVTKDVPAGVIAGGNPARVLRALTLADLVPSNFSDAVEHGR